MNRIAQPFPAERVESQSDPPILVVRLDPKLLDRTRPDGGEVVYRVRVLLEEVPVGEETPPLFEVAAATIDKGEVKIDSVEPTIKSPLAGTLVTPDEEEYLRSCFKYLLDDYGRGLMRWSTSEGDDVTAGGITKLTRAKLKARLLAPSEVDPTQTNFQKVAALKEGGVLFGVDRVGKLLAADDGEELVYFALDSKGQIVPCYKQPEGTPATYAEIYEQVYGPPDRPTGYEMFPRRCRVDRHQEMSTRQSFEVALFRHFTEESFGPPRTYAFLDNGRDGEIVDEKGYAPGYQIYTMPHGVTQINSSHDWQARLKNRGTRRLYRF